MVAGQAAGASDPVELGEVDAEHEADEQADDRDHEEPDDAEHAAEQPAWSSGCRPP